MQSLTVGPNGPYALSPAQITDILNYKSSRAISTPRYRLLDNSLKPVPTGGTSLVGDPADLTDYVQGCSVTCDTTRDIQRDAQITMKQPPAVVLDTLSHRIASFLDFWTLQSGTPQLLFTVATGVWNIIIPDRAVSDSGTIWTLNCLDRTSELAQVSFINTYAVAKATNVNTATTSLLTMDYLPKSQGGTGQTPAGLDDAGAPFTGLINLDPTTATTPACLSWDWKTTKLAAINQLRAGINHSPLWATETGGVASVALPDYSVSPPPFAWTYASGPNSTIKPPTQWQVTNQGDIANCVVVKSEHNTAAPISAVAYNNNNTSSAIALSRLKRAIVKVVQDDTILDAATAQTRAKIELQLAAALAEKIALTVMPNPFIQPYDVLSVTITDATGAVQIGNPLGFQVLGWTADHHAKTQTFVLGRVVPV